MNENIRPTVDELLAVKAKLEPLEARYEVLKELIRPAGADTYDVPGVGKVIVSAPVERRAKGSEIVIDHAKLEAADRKFKAKLFELGILKTETTYTRASKAKVEVQLAEEVKKAA
ncbi:MULTISPECIES: hypothetical protein [unclassified Mesorhizobium]|uniref:hypothetical protein n=1 Tax=unclassified Mesorhizobium TaxID=325217 RepID=UPI00112A3530|nr:MULTISPECIES: hypothetical protein [unclassified Mesorhizobium]TPJ51620.1 hypothetical protein FJ426_20525 [Mesorhizobium sp. B2-6-4]TPN42298.1 hypothetical protein FJ979_01805 [Mesorhizobium sp. B1-1-6]